MHHLVCKQPFSCGEPSLVPSNHNNRAQSPCFNLGLDFVKKEPLHFGDSTRDWVKEKEEAIPSQSMALRQRNSKGTNVPSAASEPMGENEVASRQRNEVPLVEQEVVLGQRRVRQEPDPVAQMAEMLKDLQQEIRLLKESRTQEIRDNVPPVVNQDKAQPECGSAVGGGGNPQYLTLADDNALLEQEREKLSRIPKQFSRDPSFPQELLASHIPYDMKPQSSIILMEEMEVLWNT